jgi:lipopolysaccharide transport system ATP-binding protein
MLLDQGRVAFLGSAVEAVSAYREMGAHDQTEREWPSPESRPGNEHVRVRAVRIKTNVPGEASQITVRTPFDVEVAYESFFTAETSYVGMRLRTVTGEIVFSSGSQPAPVARGRYLARCRVPGDLLNSGAYMIDLAFARDGAHALFRFEEALAFEVHDVERPRGGWLGPIPGAVRPRLDWRVERMEAA